MVVTNTHQSSSVSTRRSQRGIALVLVIFIIALASILVVNLAYSTYLDSRVSTAVQRSVQAEYLLKSALNFARALIQNDNPQVDSPKDDWAMFYDGREVPLEYFGIDIPNIRLYLEIRPEDTKIRVSTLTRTPGNKPDWRGIMVRLFQGFNFDNDTEIDHTGFFPKKHFDSDEMVAALVDYQDSDPDSVQPHGIENDLPKETFPNTQMVRLTELSSVPGFSPARVRQLLPYLTTHGAGTLNINFIGGMADIEPRILGALHPDIDGADVAGKLRALAQSDQPIESYLDSRLNDIFPPSAVSDLGSLSFFTGSSSEFQIIAKVDYDTSAFFLRAFVHREKATSPLPIVSSVELY